MRPHEKDVAGNIKGRNNDTTTPEPRITNPIIIYTYPNTDMISLICCLSPLKIGLYKTYPIAVPTPNSARFKNPKILLSVPLKPINSVPR